MIEVVRPRPISTDGAAAPQPQRGTAVESFEFRRARIRGARYRGACMRSNSLKPVLPILLFAAVLAVAPSSAYAQRERAVGPTPPRLAFFDGDVSFWRQGAEDWAGAQVNTALAAGDELYAPAGAHFEIEI